MARVSPDPEHGLSLDALEHALTTLESTDPKRRAYAVWMRYTAGMTYAQIGTELGVGVTWAYRIVADGVYELLDYDVDSRSQLHAELRRMSDYYAR